MVLELPELTRENQDWKIYRAHILDSAAAEGVVSHLSGAAPKPVDSRELEAWNTSNAVAKYIILEVITDSLLEQLVHHELAHTLFSHLAAIFGDHKPIAIEPPAEWSHQDKPLCKDSHPKSDGAYSARTAEIIDGNDVEGAGAAAETPENLPYAPDRLSSADRNQEKEQCGRERNAHDTNRDKDLTSLPFELKTTEFRNEKPSGTTPAGIPSIHNTNSTTIYSKAPGNLPNAPDGMSRGDIQKTAESGGQWQRTAREVTRNDRMASPAPNTADRMSEMMMGNGPIPFSRKRPINAVKYQRMSTRYIPPPNGCANTNAQHSNRHLKPKIHLPRWHRLPLEGERNSGAAVSPIRSSSGQSMPQKLAASPNESETLVTASIESETPHSSETPRVCLGSANWRTDDLNGLGGQTDGSHGGVDVSRGQADIPGMSNHAETAILGHRDDPSTHLGAGDVKHDVDEMDGLGSHMDALSGCTDTPSVQTNALIPRDASDTVSIPRTKPKPPNLPGEGARLALNKLNDFGSHTDVLSLQTDAPSVQTGARTTANKVQIVKTLQIESNLPKSLTRGEKWPVNETNSHGNPTEMSSARTGSQNVETDVKTAENASRIVRMRQNKQKPQNLPAGDAKHTVDETDGIGSHTGVPSVHTDALTPRNKPQTVKMPANKPKPQDSPSRRAGWAPDESNGRGNRTDTSSACRDSHSVGNEMETAADEVENVRTGSNDSKTRNSPKTPENGTFRPPRQRRKVSQVRNIETAYLACAHAVQPHGSPPKRSYSVYRPCRRCGRIKSAPRNISQTQERETAHLQRVHFTQPHGKNSDWVHGVNGPSRQCGRLEIEAIKVNPARNGKTTHLGCMRIAQPPEFPSKCLNGVIGLAMHQRQHSRIKFEPTNVSPMQNDGTGMAYLGHDPIAQPCGDNPQRWYRVHRPSRQRGRIKFAPRNVSRAQEVETAHLRCGHAAHPHGSPPKRSYRVIGPRRRRGRLKVAPTNVSRTREDWNTYQGLYKPIHHLPRDPVDPTRSISIGNLLYGLQNLKNKLQNVSRDNNKSIASSTHLSANGSTTRNAFIANT
ncbi:hypothetical protein SCLCIDRAFT_1210857 [Scleroderma citrinum Foug A]|uniref:Uncharacterized protein n=1 Tax=Scleroderma citrinum Foug A TaxID=1036808 RepID=A0A0C3EFU6_9AGAM|nr:hypothetical protein SCLCIDRAFT_1210857 [Scleroderma citrinum Foug A]